MSSEAITQNDLREILSRTVGSVPSEYKKLLWTNPNIDTDFAPQTILNNNELVGYDEVEIWASFLGSNSPMYVTRCAIGATNTLAYQNLNTATSTNASTFINGVARDVTVTTSGITFGNGQMTYSGGAYVNWQSRAIPYKVYGIKYDKIAPPQVDASDYVIEQGTSGNWIYRKWDSGMVEGWYAQYVSVAVDNAYGYAYYHDYPTSVPYPTMFISHKTISADWIGGNNLIRIIPVEKNGNYLRIYSVAPQNTTASGTLCIYMTGAWK